MIPYRPVKPQGFGPGVFYRLTKDDGLMILAFSNFVSLIFGKVKGPFKTKE
jgi:hypothetical protein